jgi:hypothetical protein
MRIVKGSINMKKILLSLSPLLLVIVITACSTNNDIGETKAPVYLVVHNISAGSHPFGDIISSDGIIFDDTVNVEFQNRVKDPDVLLTPRLTNSTYTDIVVNNYRVYFSRTDGGTVAPDGFESAMNFYVRTNSYAATNLVLIHAHQKSQPPISFLQPYNLGFEPSTNYTCITCRSFLEFWGETFAGEKVFAKGAIEITFADYGD